MTSFIDEYQSLIVGYLIFFLQTIRFITDTVEMIRRNAIVGIFLAVLFICVQSYHLQNNENKLYFGGGGEADVSIDVERKQSEPAVSFSKSFVEGVGSLECSACKVAMDVALWRYRTPDKNYTKLFRFIIQTCIDFHIEQSEVCTGIVKAMQNETQFLLYHINVTGEILCGIILPDQCQPKDLPWNTKKWVVSLPKQSPDYKPRNKTSGKSFKVLQISDLHIDLKYTPGSQVNCNEPLCCRQPAKSGDTLAGYWGTAAYCDTPYWTVENFLQHVSKEKFDYILWTGDLPAHDDWDQSRISQEYLLKNLTSLLLQYFPNTPIYPALGNHESYPVNSFPPDYVTGYNQINWLYDTLAKSWSPWLTDEAINTVKTSGFYTILVKPGLRLVSLNMNYCNNQNYWMLLNPEDPNGELHWLVDTLYQAENNGELVHIIGHIPPNVGGDCLTVWRNNFYNIVVRFQGIVRGQFFGHTHSDQFEIIYSNSSFKKPVSVVYISPSITTFTNLNPGYRVYDMDSQSWNVLDHHTFILNLTKANQPKAQPVWEYEYSARSAYNLTSLSPDSWDQLYKSWLHGGSTSTFQAYYKYFYKGLIPSPNCDSSCKRQLLCSIAGGNVTYSYCT